MEHYEVWIPLLRAEAPRLDHQDAVVGESVGGQAEPASL